MIKTCLKEWRALTSDVYVLSCVQGLEIEFIEIPVQDVRPSEYRFNKEKCDFMNTHINSLLEKGAIALQEDIPGLFLSNIFLVPKPNGTFRMILDLSVLNNYVRKESFKMETLDLAIRLMSANCFMSSIDLTEAYYAIPVGQFSQRFLCFSWCGKIYRFLVMPFGLTSAPRLFTRVMKPVFADFRLRGGTGLFYIDDSLLLHPTREGAEIYTKLLCNMMFSLGFTVKIEKSVLNPTNTIEFLGYSLCSKSMCIWPTEKKVLKIKEVVLPLLQGGSFKIRQVASVIGFLNDVCKAADFGLSHLKWLELDKIYGLRMAGEAGFEGNMSISPKSVSELRWWETQASLLCRKIRVSPPKLVLCTDASRLGWGATCEGLFTGGRWTEDLLMAHINELELTAVYFALQYFFDCKRGVELVLRTDNVTAVAYLKHQGGTKSDSCNRITLKIMKFCEDRSLWIWPSFIPGKSNAAADFYSRNFSVDTEWCLGDELFQGLCDRWFTPEIDLFASSRNFKLPRYCSWGPDPHAEFIDAFTLDWSQFKSIYLFPPFRLLGRCLQKLRIERVPAIIVAPQWWGQIWSTVLHQMAEEIWFIAPMTGNLYQKEVRDHKGKSLEKIPLWLVRC